MALSEKRSRRRNTPRIIKRMEIERNVRAGVVSAHRPTRSRDSCSCGASCAMRRIKRHSRVSMISRMRRDRTRASSSRRMATAVVIPMAVPILLFAQSSRGDARKAKRDKSIKRRTLLPHMQHIAQSPSQCSQSSSASTHRHRSGGGQAHAHVERVCAYSPCASATLTTLSASTHSRQIETNAKPRTG